MQLGRSTPVVSLDHVRGVRLGSNGHLRVGIDAPPMLPGLAPRLIAPGDVLPPVPPPTMLVLPCQKPRLADLWQFLNPNRGSIILSCWCLSRPGRPAALIEKYPGRERLLARRGLSTRFVASPQHKRPKSVSLASQPYAAAIGSLMVPGGLGQKN